MERPVIGIPMGDPAGIGPEIVMKALTDKRLYEISRPFVAGSGRELEKIEAIIQTGLKLRRVEEPGEGNYEHGTVDLVSVEDGVDAGIEFGKVQEAAGRIAYGSIALCTRFALEDKADAIATTPINKEAIKAAGIKHIGHTEMLAELTGTEDPLTMFQVRNLRVFFLSRHVSLRKACDLVKKERLTDYLVRCSEALGRLGLSERTIAVAGLNPHNGEHGLFGDEEGLEVEPAIREAVKKGVDAVGPVPADSVFHLALNGRFAAVLSLYHDQGHIATKTLDFERTISLTIGMPFLRTSVDHGTAFDIAGRGEASAVSMAEAIRLAAEYGSCYRRG